MLRIFISHSHLPQHTAAYNDLVRKLDDKLPGGWYNCSVPRNRRYGVDQSEITDDEMERLLAFHIDACDVLVIASKPVVSKSRWLKFELKCAREKGKPVVSFWRPRVDANRSRVVAKKANYSVETGRIDTLINTIEQAVESHPTALGPLPQFSLPISNRPQTAEPMPINVARGAEGSPFYSPMAPPIDAEPPRLSRLPSVMTNPVAEVLADVGATASEPAPTPVREVIAPPLQQAMQDAGSPTGTTAEVFVGDDPPTRSAENPQQALAPDRPKPGLWQRVTGLFVRGGTQH